VTATLNTLAKVKAKVRWMSIEPLSFDITKPFETWLADNGHYEDLPIDHAFGTYHQYVPMYEMLPIEWAVVGAATNGPKVYQPEPLWVKNLLAAMNEGETPVFFKGNIRGTLPSTNGERNFRREPCTVHDEGC